MKNECNTAPRSTLMQWCSSYLNKHSRHSVGTLLRRVHSLQRRVCGAHLSRSLSCLFTLLSLTRKLVRSFNHERQSSPQTVASRVVRSTEGHARTAGTQHPAQTSAPLGARGVASH